MTSRDDIVVLPGGQIATVSDPDKEGWHTAAVLWAPADSPYQPGGNRLAIPPQDIANSRVLAFTKEMAALLIAGAQPTDESQLVVDGATFRAPMPDDTDTINPKQHDWMIVGDTAAFSVACINEDGVEAVFDYRALQRHRRLRRAVDSGFLRGSARAS